ncbi:carbohydrate binding-domain-containing protein, partial [Mycena epipterygia]
HRISIAFSALIAVVVAQTFSSCGSANYDPTQYTCFNGTLLCPIVNGTEYLACGDSCYPPNLYSCDGDFLCPFGDLNCAGACYNPELFVCISDRLRHCNGLFTNNEDCSDGCFCCAGLIQIGPICQNPCGFPFSC